MKIIISHDVDHLLSSEHFFKDLYFPKLWIRTTSQLIRRKITLVQWFNYLALVFNKKLTHADEVMELDKLNSIPSTFFFAMSDRGRSMSYNSRIASDYINLVRKNGFSVGVHGVESVDVEKMTKENEIFKKITGIEKVGVRMHYLLHDNNTLKKLDKIGYIYDSTEYKISSPYKIGEMWEFPLCLMDQYVIMQDMENSKMATIKLLEEAELKKIPFFTILFHDHLYSEAEIRFKFWYLWLISYLREKGYEFVSYESAINSLNAG